MKKELLSNDKFKIIFRISLFCIIFTSLLLVATFYDLAISKILTAKSLPAGEYFSTSTFGLFFETIGSFPIWFAIVISAIILFWYCPNFKYKKLAVFLSVFSIVITIITLYLFFDEVFKYVGEHAGVRDHMKSVYMLFVKLVLASMLGISLLFAFKNFSLETRKTLLKFAFVCVCSAAFFLIITFIKNPVGRMRFRSMNAIGDSTYSGFTQWFVVNGKRTIDGLPSDSCKSFPSGHTFAAGIMYAIICLPDLFKRFNTKAWRFGFYAISITYVGLVAVSRIVVGAHYMSDVLFGGTIAYLGVIIFREVFILKGKNFKILFGKKTKKVNDTNVDNATQTAE